MSRSLRDWRTSTFFFQSLCGQEAQPVPHGPLLVGATDTAGWQDYQIRFLRRGLMSPREGIDADSRTTALHVLHTAKDCVTAHPWCTNSDCEWCWTQPFWQWTRGRDWHKKGFLHDAPQGCQAGRSRATAVTLGALGVGFWWTRQMIEAPASFSKRPGRLYWTVGNLLQCLLL